MVNALLFIFQLITGFVLGILIFKHILNRPGIALLGFPFMILHFISFPSHAPIFDTARLIYFWGFAGYLIWSYGIEVVHYQRNKKSKKNEPS